MGGDQGTATKVAFFAAGAAIAAEVVRRYVMAKAKSLPPWYQVPEKWTYEEGKMGEGSNRPTAGARVEKPLPRGDHALQLYSLGTPNGVKVTILLEELNELKGVEYDAFRISLKEGDQFGSGFVAVNPNSKIPALLDVDHSPPIRVFESGAILKYVAEKHDAFVPKDPRLRAECFSWLFWQVGAGPYVGSAGLGYWWRSAPVKIKFAVDRATLEVKRQLSVLDTHLAEGNKTWLCGDEYTVADMAIWPWIMCLDKWFKAGTYLDLDSYPHLTAWAARVEARPAVKRGVRVNGLGADAVKERHSKADFD